MTFLTNACLSLAHGWHPAVRVYLRYVWIAVRSEELAALPEAVEGRDDGTGYDDLEDLLHEVLVEARTGGQLAQVLQRPRHLTDEDLHAEGLLHDAQVRQQRLIVQYRRVLVLECLYEELVVGGGVHVAEVLVGVGELLLETPADLQPQLVHVRVDDDGLEADTEGAEYEGRHEDDDAGVLVNAPADLEEVGLEEVPQVDARSTPVRLALRERKEEEDIC
jgi:hypothetical protein